MPKAPDRPAGTAKARTRRHIYPSRHFHPGADYPPDQLSDTALEVSDQARGTEPPVETVPQEPAPAEPESTPQGEAVTKPVQQNTSDSDAAKSTTTTQPEEPPADDTNTGTTQTQQPQQNKDGWNQAFYETLTPEQKKVYEGFTDATDRNMMQQSVEKKRQREAEGWIVNAGTPTEEQLEEAWGNMTFGQ